MRTPERIRWEPTIAFVDETPCARETYTIDSKTEAVNDAGTRVSSDAKMCNMRAAGETEDKCEYQSITLPTLSRHIGIFVRKRARFS
jgi:hypothetical protein